MVNAIYEPHMREIHLSDGRCLPVPEPIVIRGSREGTHEVLKHWAVRSGFIREGDDIGVIGEEGE